MEHTTTTTMEPFPALDSAPTTPEHEHDAPPVVPALPLQSNTPELLFQIEYEGPLYTEINIPLPHISPRYYHASPSTTTGSSESTTTTTTTPAAGADKPRGRSRTLSSLSPFRNRRSSSAASTSPKSTTTRHSEEWPRIRKDIVKSREVNAMMDLRHQSKRSGRSGTIDALAVVPAVLVLSAELFTPGDADDAAHGGKRKDSGVGRWEDGIR